MPPGQETGHAPFTWADLIEGFSAELGSLAAVALHLAERREFKEGAESVERGLRRLRDRGMGDGGVWGQRVLRVFGLPASVTDRVRWMGQYHTRFTDLPASLCAELLRPWDRPPVSESPARVWVLLGRANLALRARVDATPLLEQASLLQAQAEVAARVEWALVMAFVVSRRDPDAARRALAQAEAGLGDDALDAADRACLFARWIDQVAYPLNRPGSGAAHHAAAADLYRRIPDEGPLFARSRRANGLGWSLLQLGDRSAAEAEARLSVRLAGDAGSLRMRAMALNLLAEVTEGAEAADAHDRALGIARGLEDEALRVRFGGGDQGAVASSIADRSRP